MPMQLHQLKELFIKGGIFINNETCFNVSATFNISLTKQ
jgi:hypothetical protein